MLPTDLAVRRLALSLVLLAILVLPATATASQLIARDARDVTLRVDARGQALVSYRAKGRLWTVLAWGAVNALHPTADRSQVRFKLDYAGGWGKYRKTLSREFRNACRPYAGPPLAAFVAGCTMPEAGYPIVMYAHGTGGDYQSYVNDGTARALAERCIASMGVDQIFHGTRRGAPDNPEDVSLLFFNFQNVIAARTNARQSALDEVQRARLFTETHATVPAEVSVTGTEIRFEVNVRTGRWWMTTSRKR